MQIDLILQLRVQRFSTTSSAILYSLNNIALVKVTLIFMKETYVHIARSTTKIHNSFLFLYAKRSNHPGRCLKAE